MYTSICIHICSFSVLECIQGYICMNIRGLPFSSVEHRKNPTTRLYITHIYTYVYIYYYNVYYGIVYYSVYFTVAT